MEFNLRNFSAVDFFPSKLSIWENEDKFEFPATVDNVTLITFRIVLSFEVGAEISDGVRIFIKGC